MKYLVTGSKGQLGFDIVRELQKRGITDIVSIDKEDLDLTDGNKVHEYVLNMKPDVIFHTAAWTNVDEAEEQEDLVYDINVKGTSYLVDAAEELGCKIFYISTEYVFDGKKSGLYEVDDPVNPLNVYGKTKFLGEQEVRQYSRHFIIRTSWLFGINGSNFVETILKLGNKQEEINVVSDQLGSPTYTVDLAKLLVDMSKTEKYGTYHASNDGFCSWADLAEYIFKLNEKTIKVNHINASEYPSQALRPLNSKLSKKSLIENGFKTLPSWKDAIDRYHEELIEKSKQIDKGN